MWILNFYQILKKKYFFVHERSAVKNLFITYVFYASDVIYQKSFPIENEIFAFSKTFHFIAVNSSSFFMNITNKNLHIFKLCMPTKTSQFSALSQEKILPSELKILTFYSLSPCVWPLWAESSPILPKVREAISQIWSRKPATPKSTEKLLWNRLPP